MAMETVMRARQLIFGTLPINLLDRSSLSPYARLLWAVLDSCAAQHVRPSIEFLAIRMGLEPKSRATVYRALDECVTAGFLEVLSTGGAEGVNAYKLKLPDYCLVDTPEILLAAFAAPVQANVEGWAGAQGRTAKRKGAGPAFDRAAWILGKEQKKAQRAVDLVQQPGGPAPAAKAPLPVLEMPVTAPPGWEDFKAAFEKHTTRRFVWTPTSCKAAARITKQVGADLVPGICANFFADEHWKAKRYPWAALVKGWADLVPGETTLTTCAHRNTTTATERAQHRGKAGAWQQLTCSSCGTVTERTFVPDMPADELATYHASLRAAGAKLKHLQGSPPGAR